jgi:hypothetical protein
MVNFIIALFVKKELLSEEEGQKLAKAVFGRPIPQEYDSCLSFVERLLTEAKLSSTRKYFNPTDFNEKARKTTAKTVAQKNK